jgi:hypothetical protein
LSEDEVVRTEDLTIGASADGVHGSGLKVHEDGTGDIASASGLIEVHVDALQLEVRVTLVGSGWVDAVLVRDNLPELAANLVATLASLNGNDLTHAVESWKSLRTNHEKEREVNKGKKNRHKKSFVDLECSRKFPDSILFMTNAPDRCGD